MAGEYAWSGCEWARTGLDLVGESRVAESLASMSTGSDRPLTGPTHLRTTNVSHPPSRTIHHVTPAPLRPPSVASQQNENASRPPASPSSLVCPALSVNSHFIPSAALTEHHLAPNHQLPPETVDSTRTSAGTASPGEECEAAQCVGVVPRSVAFSLAPGLPTAAVANQRRAVRRRAGRAPIRAHPGSVLT